MVYEAVSILQHHRLVSSKRFSCRQRLTRISSVRFRYAVVFPRGLHCLLPRRMTPLLTELAEKIVELVPDSYSPHPAFQSFSLEDVLRALEPNIQHFNDTHDPRGEEAFVHSVVTSWDLGKSLDQQDPKTIQFLHDLLV